MKHIGIIFLFTALVTCLLAAFPALADRDRDEVYGKWYGGDWMAQTETMDGQQVWYGLRVGEDNHVYGCIIYPKKDGVDRKLFGEIIDTDPKRIEIRLSNGNEIELKKIGKEPDNTLRYIKQAGGNRVEAEFKKEFLPSNCI